MDISMHNRRIGPIKHRRSHAGKPQKKTKKLIARIALLNAKKKERPKKNDKNLETEQTAPLLSERIDNNRAQEQTNSDADRNLNNRVANIKSDRVETSA